MILYGQIGRWSQNLRIIQSFTRVLYPSEKAASAFLTLTAP